MIQINIPGAENNFVIYDCSKQKTIEHEFESKFYPYTVIINGDLILREKSLIFVTDGYQLTVIYGNNFHSFVKQYPSINITYKKICTFIRDNLIIREGFCLLHGAAISLEGHVSLFLAETNTGKSTFAVYSEYFGHTCITDDLIILDTQENMVYPISKYAHIRLGAEALLPNQHRLFYNPITMRYNYPLKEERFNKKYIVEYIFIINRNDSIVKADVADNPLEAILDNMFLPYQVYNNIVSSIKIKDNYPIYNICYRKLEELNQEVMCLLNSNEK